MAERGGDGANGADGADGTGGGDGAGDARARAEQDADRGLRRAVFLRELDEARKLRDRVQPRRARAERARRQLRMRTFRW
ncbi:hypothetical protein [Actinacidiphila sp. bgisy167]|uniref:hypothetical protein n=1 Tax=Actinacidiphila sp. bgisy167 TaxID=3413797 RepID=UPI003D7090C5